MDVADTDNPVVSSEECAAISNEPSASRIPSRSTRLPLSMTGGSKRLNRLGQPVASRPLGPLKQPTRTVTDSTPASSPYIPPQRGTNMNRRTVAGRPGGVARRQTTARPRISRSQPRTRGTAFSTSTTSEDTVDDGSQSSRSSSGSARSYSSARARIKVRGGRPIMRGFGNVGAVFGEQKAGEELHPQILKMARKSGHLNLSNKGLIEVPSKVYHINVLENDEAKQLTLTMSMDGSGDDRWWEQNDLTRLYLSSNALTTISSEISNLVALQILDLSDNNLVSLPSSMGELSYLNRLNLSHNKLECLPSGLFSLADLRSLQVDHNELSTLPDDLGNLNVLEYLDLSHNKLESIPPSIGYLHKLSKLNASDNIINNIPDEIGDLFGLALLDLSKNQVSVLPTTVGRLQKLEQLYLRSNRLKVLPPLEGCTALKELHLGNNFITELTEEQLNNLSGVRVLDLRDNKLEHLPDQITFLQSLERLDITNNNLSTLPFHMGLLPNLKSMSLDGNPMRFIRRDIIQRGTMQLLKYLRTRVSAPINSFPGFEGSSTECNFLMDTSNIPDKYQMRSSQTMAYNEKATNIPDLVLENGHEAAVKTVDLSKNLLVSLPTKLEELNGHVSEMVLSNNRLESLPTYLGNFRHVMFLDVQGNRLTDLPTELSQLPHLREVNMNANRLEQLPSCLYEMNQLEILIAGENKITNLHVEGLSKMSRLATLDLHNNNIDYIPHELGHMTQLRCLLLEGNPFRVPRAAILAKGTREVLEYLRSRITAS